MDLKQFEERKLDHIRHSLDRAHQALGLSGLESVHLAHEALPDLDFEEVALDSPCLGVSQKTPFYIAAMTAGHEQAFQINRTLALACQERGWAMGVGSQRRELEGRGAIGLDSWKELREEVPRLILFANLGISQVIRASIQDLRRVIEGLQAQALVIHLNALQEVVQPEGTPQFKGSFKAIERVLGELEVPVILKETGCGFSESTLHRISSLRLGAVDLSGLGGTHWGRIEGARAEVGSIHAEVASTFANWGESTVASVRAASRVLPKSTEVWASGGVRTGLDAAKLIALGADRVGFAKPALEAALGGLGRLRSWMETREYELRAALFCTGSATCPELRKKEVRVLEKG